MARKGRCKKRYGNERNSLLVQGDPIVIRSLSHSDRPILSNTSMFVVWKYYVYTVIGHQVRPTAYIPINL